MDKQSIAPPSMPANTVFIIAVIFKITYEHQAQDHTHWRHCD